MHHHYLLHKPSGYVSQFITNELKRVKRKKFLGELFDFRDGTMAVGRLDLQSEGLLLLTTDGKVSAAVRSKAVEKEYLAQVHGEITEQAAIELSKGVEIRINGEAYQTQECSTEVCTPPNYIGPNPRGERHPKHGPTSWVKITISEGKFRQVRKMTAAVGHPTLRLIRIRVGKEKLEGIEPGKVKEVEAFQL
ncbi:MAG: pseudouridine synthase [Flavobacteriales bacterium]